MQIEITHEMHRLAEELAAIKGESLTAAVTNALQERLDRERPTDRSRIAEQLMEIGRRYSRLPDADIRTAEEILGYDENGLPT
jgi:antitoxin VapB